MGGDTIPVSTVRVFVLHRHCHLTKEDRPGIKDDGKYLGGSGCLVDFRHLSRDTILTLGRDNEAEDGEALTAYRWRWQLRSGRQFKYATG